MDDDVRHLTLAGPLGPYHVATTDRGIVAAAWRTTQEDFLASVSVRVRGRSIDADEAEARLDAARPILETLLRGEPADPRNIEVDLADRPTWDRRVLSAVRDVGWGQTASYGDIAKRIGAPRAARAVGGALGRNPITLIIPCHRIIAGDGTIGGYGGDAWGGREASLQLKRDLLLREGVTVPSRDG